MEFPESADAVNDYPIVQLKDAQNAEAAKAFIELVRSAEGQQVLTGPGSSSRDPPGPTSPTPRPTPSGVGRGVGASGRAAAGAEVCPCRCWCPR